MNAIRKVSHCSHWGAYTILTQNGKIIGIEPSPHDPDPSPIIQSAREWAKADRRVPSPLVREGWLNNRGVASRRNRGNERFVQVSWERATQLVANEIKRVATAHGSASIFAGSYGWASCGRFHHSSTLLKRLLNLVGGFTGHVDTYSIAAGPVILRHVLGSGDAATKGTTLDTVAGYTDILLAFGALTPRTAQNEAGGLTRRTFEMNLRRMAERGMQIVHISPLRDDIPEWAGAEWVPIRPNTDTALVLALTAEVVRAGNHDADFLARYCSGSEAFLDYLSGVSDGEFKGADWAAPITGIPAKRIRELSRQIVGRRSMVAMSWSLQRAHHGEQPYWAGLGLAAALGQIGLPGGGMGFGYASLGGIGGPISVADNPAISSGRKALDSFIPVARITDMLMNPGGSYSYEGRDRIYPDTRLVYWAGGNPFHHHQDLNRLAEAFTRPETIIVQDPLFTATAQYADIVLPATSSIERNDIAANSRSDMMIAMQQAIPPFGLARNDYDIFADIAKVLGVWEDYTEGRNEMEWLRHLYEGARRSNRMRHGLQMPDFDRFWQRGWTESVALTDYVYLADYRADPEGAPLNTESGRIVLTSKLLTERGYDDCTAYPSWIEPAEWLGHEAARDQLHLISQQPAGRLHSQLETGAASLRDKRMGRETARLSMADAKRLGIAADDTIRIWNARGACLATALPDAGVIEGVLVLPTGAWLTQTGKDNTDVAGNPNVLTPDLPASQFSQGCAAHTCLVSVERYKRPNYDAFEDYRKRLTDLAVLPEAPEQP